MVIEIALGILLAPILLFVGFVLFIAIFALWPIVWIATGGLGWWLLYLDGYTWFSFWEQLWWSVPAFFLWGLFLELGYKVLMVMGGRDPDSGWFSIVDGV